MNQIFGTFLVLGMFPIHGKTLAETPNFYDRVCNGTATPSASVNDFRRIRMHMSNSTWGFKKEFPGLNNWVLLKQVKFKDYLDDTTLIVERSTRYTTPSLKVLNVQTFDCTFDTSGTYDDFDSAFEY